MVKFFLTLAVFITLGINCPAQNNNDSKKRDEGFITFSGVVYDTEGSAVFGAHVSVSRKISANDTSTVQSRTDEGGRFRFILKPGTYELVVDATQLYFKKTVYSNLRIVNSTWGTFNQDIVLEAGRCDDCSWIRDGLEPIPDTKTKPQSIP
jgi:hypothetical protein